MGQIPYSWVEKFFGNLTMLYGNRMEKMWQGLDRNQVMAFWHQKLDGYSRDEFTRGVKAVDSLEYPPTLPQFLNLCRPPVDPVKAYHEAVKGVQDRRNGRRGEWSHPAIFWTAASMAHDLLNMGYQQVKPHFEKRLADELSKTVWQAIPDVQVPLPPPTVDREKARAEAEAALKRIGASNALPGAHGNGQWIVNNLERMGKGWEPLPGVRKCILDGAKALGIAIPEGVLHEPA